MLGYELEHVCHPEVHAAFARGSRDLHKAARVVRSDDRAPGPGDGVELPPGKAFGHARPLEAEAAPKAAAVGDVREVDHLVTGQLEDPARLALQAQLAEGLARVVVG